MHIEKMNKHKTISVAKDFSKSPAGRYPQDGPYCAEKFREELLLPALYNHWKVYVELDGTLGYSSSFLEEAFGGLSDTFNFTDNQWVGKYNITLHIISREDHSLVKEIWGYINKSEERSLIKEIWRFFNKS